VAREPREREDRESEFVDKLVHINRVAKVVKGGRRFGFAALVVVGDQRGRVGFGHGKAREVPEAIRKATDAAKRAMVRVPLKDGRTLHHETTGHHGAGKVIVRPADQGTGIDAATAEQMFEARQSRTVGHLSGHEHRKLMSSAAGVLLSKSVSLSEEIYMAMISRGFRGEIYLLSESRLQPVDYLAMAGFLAASLSAVWLGR